MQAIFEAYRPDTALEEAFAERFNETLPDEVNASQVFTIVAASVDAATERIVRLLNEDSGVPINVAFFRHFTDNGAPYLVHTWLLENDATTTSAGGGERFYTMAREQGYWKQGIFANQNSAAHLRQRFTIDEVIAVVGLDD